MGDAHDGTWGSQSEMEEARFYQFGRYFYCLSVQTSDLEANLDHCDLVLSLCNLLA